MSETIEINDRIKEIRKNYKLKHADVAGITGYALNTVKKWFTDPEAKYYQVAPIQALKLLEQWILDGAKKKHELELSVVSNSLAEVWSITNHKGGCGKTTSTMNFALMLSTRPNKIEPNRNNRVLVVDGDPQQNTTKSLVINQGDIKMSINNLLRMTSDGTKYKFNKDDFDYGYPIDLLGATESMATDIDAIPPHELMYVLKEALEPLKEHYDYIIIDGIPSKGSWYFSILVASDKVAIPFTPNKFDKWGIDDVYEHIKKIRARGISDKVRVAAVFCSAITRPLRVIDETIIDAVKESYPENFCESLIRSNIKVKEGCDMYPPIAITDYAPGSDVAREYQDVLDTIVNA